MKDQFNIQVLLENFNENTISLCVFKNAAIYTRSIEAYSTVLKQTQDIHSNDKNIFLYRFFSMKQNQLREYFLTVISQ